MTFLNDVKAKGSKVATRAREAVQPALSKGKEIVVTTAQKVDETIEDGMVYIDEHPSMIMAGLVGLAVAVRVNDTYTHIKLQEISEKLDSEE